MPKVKKNLEALKHPNSRKTKCLAKKMLKIEKKNSSKLSTHIKQNITGEKILWFKERIPQDSGPLDRHETLELIEAYLSRFDKELEQISLKNSVGQRKSRQHASREDILNIMKNREIEEFETCGIEMPDLMDPHQMAVLQNWNGELRFLQHFKLRRISRMNLA